ncbi:hypothetical protein CYLTODRAFT_415944 [Cylindrobasidium torrendii FP15055 ss-10]|uniref:MULE transposase domain-containing protein n=1 Tax=Cylindrobasidium torrendii FP15055 ss-10 TaxID=1314674 RepID=A0A0D7ATX3_9AGAR|nr:hypothetical protein CYLTODRAFT_415944 [Cylindrobasidium torrendii FP15055 ss-10]
MVSKEMERAAKANMDAEKRDAANKIALQVTAIASPAALNGSYVTQAFQDTQHFPHFHVDRETLDILDFAKDEALVEILDLPDLDWTRVKVNKHVRNALQGARDDANKETNCLGGDFAAILAKVLAAQREDPGWFVDQGVDKNLHINFLMWSTPEQQKVLREFPDVLINDNTYQTNKYGYALNIGIAVNGFGKSHSVWYAVHKFEDVATHARVFQNHLALALVAPHLLALDKSAAIMQACLLVFVTTFHLLCLHHINRNVVKNLHRILGPDWHDFQQVFGRYIKLPRQPFLNKCGQKWFNASHVQLPTSTLSCTTVAITGLGHGWR